jgi:uroporphyrinogen-III synthase
MIVPGQALAGRGIVITRPRDWAEHLAELVRAQRGHPILFPALEIREPADLKPALAAIKHLDEFQFAIFISPTAVEKALELIRARRSLPEQLRIAAVGPGSGRALERFGVTGALLPQVSADSEGLLALPDLKDISGQNIIIFRGDGGRELLRDSLEQRGACVHCVSCYRRVKPDTNPGPLLELWRREQLHAITATSSEGLRNFVGLLGKAGARLVSETPLFAPHARIAECARALGFGTTLITAPADEGLMAGLVKWFGKN